MSTIYSTLTLKEHIQKLEGIPNQNEKLFKILEKYIELFPVLDSYLFSYSPLEFLGEGILSINSSGLSPIREIRDDIRTVPIIYTAIRERKAKYCGGIEYILKNSSGKYLLNHPVHALLVTPLMHNTVVIGYICSTLFVKGTIFNDRLLDSLTRYGQLLTNVLEGFVVKEESHSLSKRELEVMQRISRGESTKEMADYMYISELTVNQYVKSAVKKLNAKNRAHAVAELLRQGIIT
jgi:DNA-binding CsgD family transcriptional regulator